MTVDGLRRLVGALALTALPVAARGQIAPPAKAPPRTEATLGIPVPQGVTAQSTPAGVQLAWQAVAAAAQYVVLRAPNATSTGTPIGTVAAGTLTFLDRGFSAAASYQVVAVATDGRRGASAAVAFQPPKVAAQQKVALTDPRPQPTPPPPPSRPVITSVAPPNQNLSVTNWYTRGGATLQVQGTGLDGLTSVVVRNGMPSGGKIVINTAYPITTPVTPIASTATGFSFVMPDVIPTIAATSPWYVIVTKGAVADTSKSSFQVAQRLTPQKITSVEGTVARAGGRIKINGIGLDDQLGGPAGVDGGYFGVGTPGSVSNPLISVGNRSATYVELWLPAICDQEGILMLRSLRPGATDFYVTADTPITVGCAQDTPTGTVEGSQGMPNNMLTVAPGSSVSIRGTDLRYVTKVTDGGSRSFPFTYGKTPMGEFLTVTMPGANPAGAQVLDLRLEHRLPYPTMAGTVSGHILINAP